MCKDIGERMLGNRMCTQAIRSIEKRYYEIRGLPQVGLALALIVGMSFWACTSGQVTPAATPTKFASVDEEAVVSTISPTATIVPTSAPTSTIVPNATDTATTQPTIQTDPDGLSSEEEAVVSTISPTATIVPTSAPTSTIVPNATDTATTQPTIQTDPDGLSSEEEAVVSTISPTATIVPTSAPTSTIVPNATDTATTQPTIQIDPDGLSSEEEAVVSTISPTATIVPTSAPTSTIVPNATDTATTQPTIQIDPDGLSSEEETVVSTISPTDTPMPPAEGYIAISNGSYHVCALKSTGEVECWGSDFNGGASPPLGEHFMQISAGQGFTCGILVDESVKCWGQIWFDDAPPRDDFVAKFSKDGEMCTTLENGTDMCWSYTTWVDVDVSDDDLPEWGDEVVTDISQGLICTETHFRDWICWAQIEYTSPSPPDDLKFMNISSGYSHVCGLLKNGTPMCWGGLRAEIPAEVSAEQFTSIMSDIDFTCGVRENDSEICWGNVSESSVLQLINEYTMISGGFDDACGLEISGIILCWNKYWGDTETYQPVIGNEFIFLGSYIGSSYYHYRCAINSNHEAICWESNGLGKHINVEKIPSETGFKQISSAKAYHACGIHRDGSISCWGNNSSGQTDPPSLVSPTPIPEITEICYKGQILDKGSGCVMEELDRDVYAFVVTETGRGVLYNNDNEILSSHYTEIVRSYTVINGHENKFTVLKAYANEDGSWTVDTLLEWLYTFEH